MGNMAWAEKHGNKYRGVYRDANGKQQRTRSVDGKRAAKKLAEDEEAKIRQGVWHDPNAGKMTFSDYFENHWLPNRLQEKYTIVSYRSHYRSALKDAFGHMELRKISKPMVQRWVNEMLKAGVSAGNTRAKYRTLCTVLGGREGVSAVEDGLIATNPCERVKLPKKKKRKVQIYSVPEVDKLMKEIDEWWQAIPLLAADTGLRWGELMGLMVDDFTLGYRAVLVQRTVLELSIEDTGNGTPFEIKNVPKSDEDRLLALSPEVSTLVEQLVKKRQLGREDRLFSPKAKDGGPLRTAAWPQGQPIRRSTFRVWTWIPAHERAGVTPVRTFHDLRGSHLSWLLGGGADLLTVMERAGHANVSTTQLYLKAAQDADMIALEALARTKARYRDAMEG